MFNGYFNLWRKVLWGQIRLIMFILFLGHSGLCLHNGILIVVVNDSRTYSCMVTDVTPINAMLNHSDVSEYLKIGPDGLNVSYSSHDSFNPRCLRLDVMFLLSNQSDALSKYLKIGKMFG